MTRTSKSFTQRLLTWWWLMHVIMRSCDAQAQDLKRPRNDEFDHDACVVTSTNACNLQDLTRPTLISPGGNTRCAFDTNVRSQLDAQYRFQVIPGTASNRAKTLVFFQGGGGCFSNATCSWAVSNLIESLVGGPLFAYTASPNLKKGMFDFDNPNNPFIGWTMVVVTYCTADVHVGNTVVQAHEDIDTMYMNGANNTETVLQWLFKNVPRPQPLAIIGTSAGAFGAIAWSRYIIEHYTATSPETRFAVLGDSFPGRLPVNQGEILTFIHACDAQRLKMEQDQFDLCVQGKLSFADYFRRTILRFPQVVFAHIVPKNDPVQKLFYCVAENRNRPLVVLTKIDECNDQPRFYAETIALLKSYTQKGEMNNFITYHLNDEDHCFLGYERLYEVSIGAKIPMFEWISQVTQADPMVTLHSACASQSRMDSIDYSCDAELSNAKFVGPDARQGLGLEDEPSIDPYSLTWTLSYSRGLLLTLSTLLMMNALL